MDAVVADVFDPNYEFEAPRAYDPSIFTAQPTSSTHSRWFDHQKEDGADVEVAPRAAMADIGNQVKKSNIVTSWGAKASKKRKAGGGAANEPATKASRQSSGEAAEPKTRAQHAATARKAKEGRSKMAKELKVGAIVMKAKKAKLKTAALVKALQPLRHMPTRSSKKLTIPEEVELHTSKRAGAHSSKAGKAADMQVEQEGDDTEGDSDASPYKPLVLRVKEFNKTPGRFKKQPDEPLPAKPLTVTEAKEPKLLTTHRARPSTFKPREVIEEEEMAKIPTFKASTLNPLILTASGKIGVPSVEKREPTEQRPFHFITDDRAEVRAARLQRQQQAAEPGPSQAALESERDEDRGERRLPAKARKSVAHHVTEARSPMLRTKFRVRESKVEEPRIEFHARPVPKYLSVPSLELPVFEPLAPTQPAPFRLATEERGAQHRQALSAKLVVEEKAAKMARIPRAQGLPLSTDMPLVPPKPEPRNLTVPEPFHLKSEARHQDYEEQRRKALEAEEAAKREAVEFRARPMWNGMPFRVHGADLPLTVPEEVPLHTKERASTREVFDKHMLEKMKEAELVAQLAAEEKREREEEERRQLRKAANFKARPMPDLSVAETFKPPPPKPLTKAMSPRLGRNKRRKSNPQ